MNLLFVILADVDAALLALLGIVRLLFFFIDGLGVIGRVVL
jgi:hypothetical protein